MSTLPTNSGIPLRMQEPQTRVIDTFAGIRAPGPSQVQPAELPRWQSELFQVANAMKGLSGSLDSMSQTWGVMAEETGQMAGDLRFAEMTPEQQREAASMRWAEMEQKYPQLKGSSPFMAMRIRENAGKKAVAEAMGKYFRENADRFSDPLNNDDPVAESSKQLSKIIASMNASPFSAAAAATEGSDMIQRFNGSVQEARRKRTLLQHDRDFQMDVKGVLEENLAGNELYVDYGTRKDGTKKGSGWQGPIAITDDKGEKTGVMTEMSVGVNIDGKEMEIPLLIPSSTPEDIAKLMEADKNGTPVPQELVDKAVDFARQQMQKGQSVWAPTLADKIKAKQDQYYTITGDSGNLAVFEATQSMARTLIASGRYGDARTLIKSMAEYSHNGQVTFGKMYAEQFAALMEEADKKEREDTRGTRSDDAYRVARAATEELFKIEANKLESMTEGELKALAKETAANAGLDPSYHGEVYDTLLEIRANQLARLERGKDADGDDLALMMRIRRDASKPDADHDALENETISAYKAGAIKRDTALSLLGQIESSKNVYADSASPGIREARSRLKFGTGINPADLRGSAMKEYDQIVSGLETQFDEEIIAARAEIIRELNDKNIPVNAESINHHLGKRANEIANKLMSEADDRVKSFRSKYEPRALFKEYSTASTVPQLAVDQINAAIDGIGASNIGKGNPDLAAALEASKFGYAMDMREFITKKVTELSQQGLEGQELYNAVDKAVIEKAKERVAWLTAVSRMGTTSNFRRAKDDFPGKEIAAQLTKIGVSNRRMDQAVPEETWGMTQASRFGNDFRDWIGELSGETDEAAIADARKNAKIEAAKFVQQVGSPISNNITISGQDILRGGEKDADATATYWNAKVQWDGLSIAEVRLRKTNEGLDIPLQYWISRFTRIKEMDTIGKLQSAYTQYTQDKTGPLAEYIEALDITINPEDVVDILRINLDEIGEGSNP